MQEVSGGEIVRHLAERLPSEFNSTDNENGSFDDRSDHKGPEPEANTAGDLAPEGIRFIDGTDGPTDKPMLAVANEVSGTTGLYELNLK